MRCSPRGHGQLDCGLLSFPVSDHARQMPMSPATDDKRHQLLAPRRRGVHRFSGEITGAACASARPGSGRERGARLQRHARGPGARRAYLASGRPCATVGGDRSDVRVPTSASATPVVRHARRAPPSGRSDPERDGDRRGSRAGRGRAVVDADARRTGDLGADRPRTTVVICGRCGLRAVVAGVIRRGWPSRVVRPVPGVVAGRCVRPQLHRAVPGARAVRAGVAVGRRPPAGAFARGAGGRGRRGRARAGATTGPQLAEPMPGRAARYRPRGPGHDR